MPSTLTCTVSDTLTLSVTVVSVADGATGGTLFNTRRALAASTPTVLFTGKPWKGPLIVTLLVGNTRVVFPSVQEGGGWSSVSSYQAQLQNSTLFVRQVKPAPSVAIESGAAIACIVLASAVIVTVAALISISVYRGAMRGARDDL